MLSVNYLRLTNLATDRVTISLIFDFTRASIRNHQKLSSIQALEVPQDDHGTYFVFQYDWLMLFYLHANYNRATI